MRPPFPLLAAVCACGLAGCSTPSPEVLHTPQPPPFAETNRADTVARPFPRAWWTLFHDPELDRLIALARAQNRDLAQASARLDAAKARARLAGSDAAPHVSAAGLANRQRTSENMAFQTGHNVTSQASGELEFAYELDLWGRLRTARLAAEKEVAFSEEERAALEISLCAQVAQRHASRLALRRETAVVAQQLARYAESESLHVTRAEAGFATELDLQRVRIEKASLEGELARLRQNEQAQTVALALLCGEAPSLTVPDGIDREALLPEFPDTLSLALLEARPDVAARRMKWEAACQRVQSARAEFFPAVRLAGTFGFAAEHPEELLEWRSHLWSLAANLTAPLLDGGRLKGNLELASAQLREAAAGYEAAVLTAYREVADALSLLRALDEQEPAALRARDAAQRALGLSRERYEKGFASYLEVVESDRARLTAQRTLIQLQGSRQIAAVDLIRALGLP